MSGDPFLSLVLTIFIKTYICVKVREGRKEGREEARKGGREEERKGGREEERKGGIAALLLRRIGSAPFKKNKQPY